jgi:hypothetical protein
VGGEVESEEEGRGGKSMEERIVRETKGKDD